MSGPSSSEIYSMAYHLYQAARYEEAEPIFRLLTTLEVENVAFWMGLAGSLQMQKKFKEAIDAYGTAAILEKSETDPLPHFHAAECFYALNDFIKAKKALKSAKKIAKKNPKYDTLLNQLNLFENLWK